MAALELFKLSNEGDLGSYNRQFLLPSTLGEALESEPVERVQFVRDEMANMCVRSRRSSRAPPAEVSMATMRRSAPEHCRPRSRTRPRRSGICSAQLWRRIGFPSFRCSAPAACRISHINELPCRSSEGPNATVGAKGVLLNEPPLPWFLSEEEVTSASTVVIRSYQRTRWYGGRTYLWVGRRRETGRGLGSSGLQFDQVKTSGRLTTPRYCRPKFGLSRYPGAALHRGGQVIFRVVP